MDYVAIGKRIRAHRKRLNCQLRQKSTDRRALRKLTPSDTKMQTV